MEHIVHADVRAAADEFPENTEARRTYITTHIERLKKQKPVQHELIANFALGGKRYHAELAQFTPEQFGEYITAMLLIVLRTGEIGEIREDAARADSSTEDPGDITSSILRKLRNK